MPLPALVIPIVLTGARTIVHRALPAAMKLIKEGGAKRATDVIKELTSAVKKSSGAGRTPVIAKGSREVSSKSADEAAELIKTGKADSAQKILNQMKSRFQKSGEGRETVVRSKVAEALAQRKKYGPQKGRWQPPKKATDTTTPKKAAAPTAGVTRAAQLRKATGTAAPKPGTKTGTSTAQQRLRRATGAATGTPKLPVGKGAKGALPTATTSKLSFAKRPKGRGKRTGLKEVGVAAAIAGGVGFFAGTGDTKSVTVKAGDTLSQIAKNNNTTLAAIKKANPNITNIHLITPGQKIKVPKVKGRKSVYQGMTPAQLQQPKKTTTAAKIKYGPPGSFGASKTGGIVKRRTGGKVKKYTGGGLLKSKPWGAAIKGRGKGYK